MKKLPLVLRSMRLRTLPLSLAGVILGLLLADCTSWAVILFTLLTTVCLQILSNISNELGDYLTGVDTDERTVAAYSLVQGGLSVKDERRLIALFVVLCCAFGALLVWSSFGTLFALQPIIMLLLGAGAIVAAMRYTLGRNPYGYRGWGDLFVLIFFGWVSVLGGYYVVTHTLSVWLLLPASAVGFFSIGVLNVNNIRDMESDAGKRITVPLKIGEHNAKIYHTILIGGGWLMLIIYLCFQAVTGWQWLCLLTLPLYARHLHGVLTRTGSRLDTMLPLLVISTFILSLLLGLPHLLTNIH